MRENLSEKIESCASDMRYLLASNIVLNTHETGMYILSQLSRGQFFHCINKYWKCQTKVCIFSHITVRCGLIHGLLNIWTSKHNLGFTTGWSETVVSLHTQYLTFNFGGPPGIFNASWQLSYLQQFQTIFTFFSWAAPFSG